MERGVEFKGGSLHDFLLLVLQNTVPRDDRDGFGGFGGCGGFGRDGYPLNSTSLFVILIGVLFWLPIWFDCMWRFQIAQFCCIHELLQLRLEGLGMKVSQVHSSDSRPIPRAFAKKEKAGGSLVCDYSDSLEFPSCPLPLQYWHAIFQKNSRRLWRSRRRKSSSVPAGAANFPAAVFLAGKCPNLGRDSISRCRKIGESFSSSVGICRKTFPAGNFGQPQPSRVF